jgi:hypothetical protein
LPTWPPAKERPPGIIARVFEVGIHHIALRRLRRSDSPLVSGRLIRDGGQGCLSSLSLKVRSSPVIKW